MHIVFGFAVENVRLHLADFHFVCSGRKISADGQKDLDRIAQQIVKAGVQA